MAIKFHVLVFKIKNNNKGRVELVTSKAWVLYRDDNVVGLQEEDFSFPDIVSNEVLIEPLYGCWESNMTHAINRDPVNIARIRREAKIILGNAGVVRVEKVGCDVSNVRAGDVCMFMPGGFLDEYGFIVTVHGYDACNTVGLLAKRTKCRAEQLMPLPKDSKLTLQQWAGFSLRFMTAWSNWKVALGALRLQLSEEELPSPIVLGWGGGTTLAELKLAQLMGCNCYMISGSDEHLREIRDMGIKPIDRREFIEINFDEERFGSDREYRSTYIRSEKTFLNIIKNKTENRGVSIVIDYIGSPVYRASLRALGRQGVLTTAGWKVGMELTSNRANECINRHVHVFTHAARRGEAEPAMQFAEENDWMPKIESEYGWKDMPQLAADFDAGLVSTYFPVFAINPE